MPNLKRPGVYVEEISFPTFVAQSPSDSNAVFVGAHLRGPLTPTAIQSWTEFAQLYGGFDGVVAPTYLALSVYAFFNNGGRRAIIQRVVHSDAVAASLALVDSAPVTTLTLTAKNPGAWGNSLYAEITAGSVAGLFNLTLRLGGTADNFVVERWTDLSMDPASSRYALGVLNNTVQGSNYVTATNNNSSTVAPGNTPVNLAPTSFGSAGVDGTAASNADYAAVFTDGTLDVIEGAILINVPGVFATAVIGPAITYATLRQNGFVVVDPDANLDASAAATYAGTLSPSSYAAVYYPWVLTADPASTVSGSVRKVPPGGFVMGIITEIDARRGVFKAPAGLEARITQAVGVERRLTNSDLDALNLGRVNAIKQIPGAGVVVYGARTLSAVDNLRYVNLRRQLISLRENALALTQFAVFEPNDYILWNTISSKLFQYLTSLWMSGGLRGANATEAFYILCSSVNNTPQTIANGEVHVEIGAALQAPAEFIVIKVGQWAGGSLTNEIA